MARLISATRYPESQEVEYITDDFSRIVHNERTMEWTLFRIPTHNDILNAVRGGEIVKREAQQLIADIVKPVRYTPPVLADAPRHSAEVMDETDD